LPLNNTSITLIRRAQVVPAIFEGQIDAGSFEYLVPFHAGEMLGWTVSLDQ